METELQPANSTNISVGDCVTTETTPHKVFRVIEISTPNKRLCLSRVGGGYFYWLWLSKFDEDNYYFVDDPEKLPTDQ